MLRAVVTQAARHPVITAGTRLSRTYPLRWNSSQPPQADTSLPIVPGPGDKHLESKAKRVRTPEELARKAALEREDDLRRDWDAKVVSYEELLPKTQNPSPVSQERVFLCV
jgi:hypothetical protein